MKRGFLTLLLLLSIGFNVTHAYVIESLDTHPCQVGEYLHEFGNATESDDICSLHHFFHIAFILPISDALLSEAQFRAKPSIEEHFYTCNSYKDFLKPPINT